MGAGWPPGGWPGSRSGGDGRVGPMNEEEEGSLFRPPC